MLMLFVTDADKPEVFDRAVKVNSLWSFSALDKIHGERITLDIPEELYGFADELSEPPFWRARELDNSPLYFKDEKAFENFRAAFEKALSLSPNGEGVFLPQESALSNYGSICGVISDMELFRLIENVKCLGNVWYFVKRTVDLTPVFLNAEKFAEDERSKAIAALKTYFPERGSEDAPWVSFFGEGKQALLHMSLKLLFTNADIKLDGVEIIRFRDYDECAFSIDPNAVTDVLGWYADESAVNSLFFSMSDLFYATV